MAPDIELDERMAAQFARLTLGHLTRKWPYRLDQTLMGPDDLALPQHRHPIFHGSFDWHSCVHGWWQVMSLRRLYPSSPLAASIVALADARLRPDLVAGELATILRPGAEGFERPYGWAWLLALHGELVRHPEKRWAAAVEPLAREIARRFAGYLPRLIYPVRSGKHDNTAFALIHALAWSRDHDPALAELISARARDWFLGDAGVQPWEPGGEDFLSPALCEAALMLAVLGDTEGARWTAQFLPDPFGEVAACIRTPAVVSDRSDGRIAHLDGLNLSRAWCWRLLARALPDPFAARSIAQEHLDAALPHLADDYMGEHWLATFALLALQAR